MCCHMFFFSYFCLHVERMVLWVHWYHAVGADREAAEGEGVEGDEGTRQYLGLMLHG